MGSTGDSYDNALAEPINGLYKVELIDPGRPWHHAADVELGTLEWIDWFNHRRPLEPKRGLLHRTPRHPLELLAVPAHTSCCLRLCHRPRSSDRDMARRRCPVPSRVRWGGLRLTRE